MAGIVTLARAKTLFDCGTLTDAQIQFRLCVAQCICETLTGLAFGAEVTNVGSSGTTYTLTIAGMAVQPDDQVWLVGPNIAVTVTAVTDDTISFEHSGSISPTKVLPMFSIEGANSTGKMWLNPYPVYKVISIKTRYNMEVAWDDDSVKTLESNQYSTFLSYGNLSTGVYVEPSLIPRRAEGGCGLIKRISVVSPTDMLINYVAGFVGQVPADLVNAIGQLFVLIGKDGSGVFDSETLDYYSYKQLSVEQLSVVPHSAQATFKRYQRLF